MRHKTNTIEVQQLDDEIVKLNNMYKVKLDGKDGLSQKYSDDLKEFNTLGKTYREFKKDSESVMNEFRNRRVKVDKDHATLKDLWSEKHSEFVRLEKEKVQNKKKFIESKIKLDNIIIEFDKINLLFSEIVVRYEDVHNRKGACDASLTSATEENQICKYNLEDRKVEEQRIFELNETCQVLRRNCETDTVSANINLTNAKEDLKQIKIKVDECYSKYNQCMMDFKKIQASYVIEKAHFGETRIRLPFESCLSFSNIKKINEADVAKYTAAVEVIKVNLEKLKCDIHACELALEPPPVFANFAGSYGSWKLSNIGGDEAPRANEPCANNGGQSAFQLLGSGKAAKSFYWNKYYHGNGYRAGKHSLVPDLGNDDTHGDYNCHILISPRFSVAKPGQVDFSGKVDDAIYIHVSVNDGPINKIFEFIHRSTPTKKGTYDFTCAGFPVVPKMVYRIYISYYQNKGEHYLEFKECSFDVADVAEPAFEVGKQPSAKKIEGCESV